jgi:AsmA protein
MRSRVKWAAALCFALLALPAGFYRWPLSSAIVIEEASARLSHSLGLELRRPARVRLNLLPMPTLRMVDVEVRGQDGATILTAPEASVRLALLPLLMGRFEFAAADLRQPTMLLDLDSRPFASGSAISTTIRTPAGATDSTSLGALAVHGGLVRVVSATRGLDTIIEDVEGKLDWPTLDSALLSDLHATWRDERLALQARLGTPADLLRGGRSDGLLSITSDNGMLRLDGAISGALSQFDGSVSADIASTSALKRLLGLSEASGLSNGRIALAAHMTTSPQMLTLSAMRLSFLEQSFEGALAFTDSARRLAVSGTLATDQLDLEAASRTMASSLVDSNGDWSASRPDLTPLTAFDFDLRISAGQIKWRGHPLTDAAIELLGKEGRLTATLAEATAYNGLVKAEIAAAPAPGGIETHASASFANADIGALCADFGWSAYSGQGSGELAFGAVGDSPAALARTLDGKATIRLAPGVVDGLSIEEALRRSERRPIDVFNDMRMGRTVFSQAAASLAIARGGAGVINASLAGPGVNLSLSGALDIVGRQMSIRAMATQTDENDIPVTRGPRLDFDIAGSWSAPTIKPFVGGG